MPPKDSYFSGNAEWELFNVTVRDIQFTEDGEHRVEAHYIMHLRRRPVYYLTVIVAPTFLISFLSILGIFAPGSNEGPRGEKVSLGLGSLLAMSVLLDIVSAAMPKSNNIPLLGFYIICSILLCALGVAVNMAMLSVSRRLVQSGRVPSQRVYRWVMLDGRRLLSNRDAYGYEESDLILEQHRDREAPRRRPSSGQSNHQNNNATLLRRKSNAFHPDMLAIQSQMAEIVEAQSAFRKKIERRKRYQMVEREWNRVFAQFDLLFLVLFSAANMLLLFLFLRFSWQPIPALPPDFVL